jgi:hypothetical protein
VSGVDDGTLDGIKRQILDCINSAYDKGYKNGLKDGNINDGTFAVKVKEAYDNGLNDAEKAVRRLVVSIAAGGLTPGEKQMIFGLSQDYVILTNFSMPEIIEKIREHDERKQQEELKKVCDGKIHIGDEVIYEGKKYIVVNKTKYEESVVIVNDTNVYVTRTENIEKTGRKYPVKEILEGLGND